MNAFRDISLVIGLFILLFLLWLASGGPQRTNTPASDSGNRAFFSFSLPDFSFGFPQYTPDYSSYGNSSKENTTPFNSSKYEGYVSISSIARSNDVDKEYVRLYVDRRSEPVNMTGWKLRSRVSAQTITIPQATQVFIPGGYNTIGSVIADSGNTIIVTTGHSPIGASFRTTLCSGYFEQFQDFTPSISKQCPHPSKEPPLTSSLTYLEDSCFDFIDRLPRCSIVTSFPKDISKGCRAYVSKYINYNRCVALYQNNADFLKDSWRVYVGRDDAVWRTRREIIDLLDTENNIVDTYSY